MEAAYDSCEAEEVIQRSDGGENGGDSCGYGLGVGDVDGYTEDARGGEVCGEGVDGRGGGAEGGVEVPEDGGGGAVFEEGTGGGEAEGAGAAGYCGVSLELCGS